MKDWAKMTLAVDLLRSVQSGHPPDVLNPCSLRIGEISIQVYMRISD